MPTAPCPVRVCHVEFRVLPMRTRFPFRYGIASLQVLPHLFVIVEAEVNGTLTRGMASEGLAPKWFTKNPASTTEADVAEMLAVIQNASRLLRLHGATAQPWYTTVKAVATEQAAWATPHGYPPLLWNLGVSLMERALLQAVCQSLHTPLHALLRTPALGILWSHIHPSLADDAGPTFLPPSPTATIQVRHTVGLADPLTPADIPPHEALHDGLPHALTDCIARYGLRYFKVKLSGQPEADTARLEQLAPLLAQHCGDDYALTLDGNENFQDLPRFRHWYQHLQTRPTLRPLFPHVLWVEQPIHRDYALRPDTGHLRHHWPEAPPLIIDESDGATGNVQRAIAVGYSGTSHKNCKGILKGLTNAAALHHHRQQHPHAPAPILSGEDLVNIGPLPLTQDLAMQALLGVTHVERNGHHYFRGLTMYPEQMALPDALLTHHPDLYHRQPDGLTTLNIQHGTLSLHSINAAPFGTPIQPDTTALPTLKEWILQGGLTALEG